MAVAVINALVTALLLALSGAVHANSGSLQYPTRVVLEYPQESITLRLDLTDFYRVKRFEVSFQKNRFLIPDNACQKFGVRLEQLIITRHTNEQYSSYFEVILYGNEAIGEREFRIGVPYEEVVPVCFVRFDGKGFLGSQSGISNTSRLAPPRDNTREWQRSTKE